VSSVYLIHILSSDLEKVLKILRSLTKLKLSTRIIRNKENAQEILRCEKMLDHSFKMFQVSNPRTLFHMDVGPYADT
jgi:hypothetical protein